MITYAEPAKRNRYVLGSRCSRTMIPIILEGLRPPTGYSTYRLSEMSLTTDKQVDPFAASSGGGGANTEGTTRSGCAGMANRAA